MHVSIQNILELLHLSHGISSACHGTSEPLNLAGNNTAENWRWWKQRFELFSLASELSEKDEKIQVATFLHTAGTKALNVCNTFSWESNDDRKKIDKIKKSSMRIVTP